MSVRQLRLGLIDMVGTLLAGNKITSPFLDQDDSKSLVVLLLGPPGAGKGTHASPLSKALGIPHISTGDLFRENICNQTPVGLKAKSYITQGCLVPDEVVLEMVFSRILNPDCAHGYILDGFPRTAAQAEAFDSRIGENHQLIALHFHIEDARLVERITGRFVCKQCSRPCHKKYAPPKIDGLCDCCGGVLYQRDDDKEDILRKRLEVYRRETQPLIDYYANKPGILKEIDSDCDKNRVFSSVLESLKVLA